MNTRIWHPSGTIGQWLNPWPPGLPFSFSIIWTIEESASPSVRLCEIHPIRIVLEDTLTIHAPVHDVITKCTLK
jgi:hypothetical protein